MPTSAAASSALASAPVCCGAVLVSLVPLVFMFAFSYLLMNRAVDRWFSQPVTQMRDDANLMAVHSFTTPRPMRAPSLTPSRSNYPASIPLL